MNKKEISALIVGIELVGCIGLAIAGYAKAQYYQGRIDFKKEMIGKLDGYIDNLTYLQNIKKGKEFEKALYDEMHVKDEFHK